MQILLTNDDGVFAPGLRALRKELLRLGDVTVVAPALEQSGVAHSITLLTPLVVKQVDDEDGSTLGWMVEGSPGRQRQAGHLRADAPASRPDRLGDQLGLERGDQRALLGHGGRGRSRGPSSRSPASPSRSSCPSTSTIPYAAKHAVRVIEKILANKPANGSLFNVNLPAHSRGEPKGIRVVPMGLGRYGEGFERRQDPRGRTYYWMTYNPPYTSRRARDRRHQPLRRLHHRHPAPLRPDPPRPDRRGQPLEVERMSPRGPGGRSTHVHDSLEPGVTPMDPRPRLARLRRGRRRLADPRCCSPPWPWPPAARKSGTSAASPSRRQPPPRTRVHRRQADPGDQERRPRAPEGRRQGRHHQDHRQGPDHAPGQRLRHDRSAGPRSSRSSTPWTSTTPRTIVIPRITTSS